MADYMILKVRITLRARTFYSTPRIEHFSKYEEDWLKYPDITVALYHQRGIEVSVFTEEAPGAQLPFASGSMRGLVYLPYGQ